MPSFFSGSGLGGDLFLKRLGGGGRGGLGDLVVGVAGGVQYRLHVVDVVILADGVVQNRTAGEVNAQIQAEAHDLTKFGDDFGKLGVEFMLHHLSDFHTQIVTSSSAHKNFLLNIYFI